MSLYNVIWDIKGLEPRKFIKVDKDEANKLFIEGRTIGAKVEVHELCTEEPSNVLNVHVGYSTKQ